MAILAHTYTFTYRVKDDDRLVITGLASMCCVGHPLTPLRRGIAILHIRHP